MKRLTIYLFISFYLSIASIAQKTINVRVTFIQDGISVGRTVLILETDNGKSLIFYSDSLIFKFTVPKVDYTIKLVRKEHKEFYSALSLSKVNIKEDERVEYGFNLTQPDSVWNDHIIMTDSHFCKWRISYGLRIRTTIHDAIPSIKYEVSDPTLEWRGYCCPQLDTINVFNETNLSRLKKEVDYIFNTKKTRHIRVKETDGEDSMIFYFSTIDSAFSGYNILRRIIKRQKNIEGYPSSSTNYDFICIGNVYKVGSNHIELSYGFTTNEKRPHRELKKIPKPEKYFVRLETWKKG
jgi:hypothetical protein